MHNYWAPIILYKYFIFVYTYQDSQLPCLLSLSDGYLFLGLAQCMKGDKEQGIANLRKAKDLGDPQADSLIEKYK